MTVECSQEMRFWDPVFDYEHHNDGSIIMRQRDELPDYLPTLAAYLDKWADNTPDQIWLARRAAGGDWQSISYGDARKRALSIGTSLLSMGLGAKKPLLILSENSLEHGLMGLACLYVGIPYAPVSPAYSLASNDHAKLKYVVSLLKPGAIFADNGKQYEAACKTTLQLTEAKIINVRDAIENAVAFDDLHAGDVALAQAARGEINKDSVVKYLFTSGSTGAPKAVINTNEMICSMQAMVRDCYRFLTVQPPVVLDWAPWNHTAAGNKVSYLTLTNGGSYYIDDGKPVPGKFDETLRNLREVACTWYFNVPLGWDMLIDALEQDSELSEKYFSQLQMMFYAGAGMAQHTWDRLRRIGRKTTGHEVLIATSLGATETAPFALACTEAQEKSGNVGVPSRGLSMKLVPVDGNKLELRLKGPSITPGYFNDPDKTQAAFDSDGYYCMGDALRAVDNNDFSKGFYFDGRLAENFKLNTGTWVAVGAVRAKLVDAMGGLVRDAVIVGENKSEVGALLLLSDESSEMDNTDLHQKLNLALAQASKSATGSASRVKRAVVLRESPSFDKGEITEKGSLNQQAMRTNYNELIDLLYSESGGLERLLVE